MTEVLEDITLGNILAMNIYKIISSLTLLSVKSYYIKTGSRQQTKIDTNGYSFNREEDGVTTLLRAWRELQLLIRLHHQTGGKIH